jgi:hypothetical protein
VPATRLSVAGDPALALVVRIFIGSVTEQWALPEPIRDDLRLAASELFSGAVEAGTGDMVTFELSEGGGGVELRADDIPVDTDEPVLEGNGGRGLQEGWTGRFALIRALFPDADMTESTVRIRVPHPA